MIAEFGEILSKAMASKIMISEFVEFQTVESLDTHDLPSLEDFKCIG